MSDRVDSMKSMESDDDVDVELGDFNNDVGFIGNEKNSPTNTISNSPTNTISNSPTDTISNSPTDAISNEQTDDSSSVLSSSDESSETTSRHISRRVSFGEVTVHDISPNVSRGSDDSSEIPDGCIACIMCYEYRKPAITPCYLEHPDTGEICLDCAIKQKNAYDNCPVCRRSWLDVYSPESQLPVLDTRRVNQIDRQIRRNPILAKFKVLVLLTGIVFLPYMVNVFIYALLGEMSGSNNAFMDSWNRCENKPLGCWGMGLIYLSIIVCIISTIKCYINCLKQCFG